MYNSTPYDLESGSSTCKHRLPELTRASTSTRITADETSVNPFSEDVVRKDELKQLERRLRVLEEEAETLKEALSESVEERAKLMSEIHHNFDTIQKHCLFQREANRGELYSHGFQIISLLKKRAGLLQVLFQDSNPAIVNKGVRG